MKQHRVTQRENLYVRRAAVVTVCLGTIALLASGYWMSQVRLPDPATADREGLVRWLALRDLDKEPPEIRNTLLHRLQEEAKHDLDPAALRSQLDPHYQNRVWANILCLIETWYFDRVDGYLATPTSERTAYLDQTINAVRQWEDLATLSPELDAAQPAGTSGTALLEIFTQQVTLWKEAASPARRREIAEFHAALCGRWLLHSLGIVPVKE